MFFGARAHAFFTLVFSYVQREREEKSSRLRASAFFNRRHIRRVHRRAKKLNLSYFRLRRVALIRLHEQRDRSDVFKQRLRRKKKGEESGGQYRVESESGTLRVRIVLKQKSTNQNALKQYSYTADKNKTKPSASLLSPRLRSLDLLISPGPTPSHYLIKYTLFLLEHKFLRRFLRRAVVELVVWFIREEFHAFWCGNTFFSAFAVDEMDLKWTI